MGEGQQGGRKRSWVEQDLPLCFSLASPEILRFGNLGLRQRNCLEELEEEEGVGVV